MTSQVGEWVLVETTETPGRVRADNGALCLEMPWAHLTPAMWEAFKAAGDALLAGAQGRKAVEIATEAGKLGDLADYAAAAFPFPEKVPAPGDMTDAHWARVDQVLRRSPAHFGLLSELWDAAGKALCDG